MKVTQNDVFDTVRRESGENQEALCDGCGESMEGAPVFSDVCAWVCADCAAMTPKLQPDLTANRPT